MATANFTAENRIIVVTNTDFDINNVPLLGEWDKDVEGRVVDSVDEFIFWKVLLTSGYYADACISYYSRDLWAILDDLFMYEEMESKRHIANVLSEEYGFVSPSTLRKKANGISNLDDAAYAMIEYLASLEEKEVNKQLNELKQAYGYEEVGVTGVFSNGEAIYHKVG